ncbi:MAG: phosphoribosylanthranilate isomerase [Gammaproteobacteria bacterium]|nr:phosphoribosylanthranilate isomerase [Gammaproteobacteria bacterium]
MRTRIKMCGFTQPEDAFKAASMGVDAIGLVFYAPSPRAVDIQCAQDIVHLLPPFVSVVGLFVNAAEPEIKNILANVHLDVLQFHGDESVQCCEAYGKPYIKAIRMRDGVDLKAEAHHYSSAQALLLDAYQKGVPGGTGNTFEWAAIPAGLRKPIILAGGLKPTNVVEAIMQVQPYAVDVSGGIELSKGIKDPLKMFEFVEGVISVDSK